MSKGMQHAATAQEAVAAEQKSSGGISSDSRVCAVCNGKAA